MDENDDVITKEDDINGITGWTWAENSDVTGLLIAGILSTTPPNSSKSVNNTPEELSSEINLVNFLYSHLKDDNGFGYPRIRNSVSYARAAVWNNSSTSIQNSIKYLNSILKDPTWLPNKRRALLFVANQIEFALSQALSTSSFSDSDHESLLKALIDGPNDTFVNSYVSGSALDLETVIKQQLVSNAVAHPFISTTVSKDGGSKTITLKGPSTYLLSLNKHVSSLNKYKDEIKPDFSRDAAQLNAAKTDDMHTLSYLSNDLSDEPSYSELIDVFVKNTIKSVNNFFLTNYYALFSASNESKVEFYTSYEGENVSFSNLHSIFTYEKFLTKREANKQHLTQWKKHPDNIEKMLRVYRDLDDYFSSFSVFDGSGKKVLPTNNQHKKFEKIIQQLPLSDLLSSNSLDLEKLDEQTQINIANEKIKLKQKQLDFQLNLLNHQKESLNAIANGTDKEKIEFLQHEVQSSKEISSLINPQ